MPKHYVNKQCIDLSIISDNKELCDPLSSSARSRFWVYFTHIIEIYDSLQK